jgi:hypothetical protein
MSTGGLSVVVFFSRSIFDLSLRYASSWSLQCDQFYSIL